MDYLQEPTTEQDGKHTIMSELSHPSKLSLYCSSSTIRLRTIVKSKCFEVCQCLNICGMNKQTIKTQMNKFSEGTFKKLCVAYLEMLKNLGKQFPFILKVMALMPALFNLSPKKKLKESVQTVHGQQHLKKKKSKLTFFNFLISLEKIIL